MPLIRSRPLRVALLAGLIGLSVAGCGRKGPLEPPPSAPNAIDLPDNQIGAVPNTLDASPLARTAKTNRAITIPNRSFPLDPLL